MYTVKCDGFPLLDVRDEELVLVNPKLMLENNTVGEVRKQHSWRSFF